MKKKIVALVLVLCVAVSVLPTAAFASDGVAINETNFPDAKFRDIVSERYDTNKDGELSAEEIGAVTDMDVHYQGITDLKGIEYFTALTRLHCSDNELGTLDVSRNTALETLICYNCGLSALDVTKNLELTDLECNINSIQELNLANNSKIEFLLCYNNSLKELDVSGLETLRNLQCQTNHLTELDLSHNTELFLLNCRQNELTSLDLENNTKLTSSRLICTENAYTIAPDLRGRFDLTSLPGSFDITKADGWTGGVVEGTWLTVDSGSTVTYTYATGGPSDMEVTLNIHRLQLTFVPEVPADCTKTGTKAHYICEDCGRMYEDAEGSVPITDEASLVIPAKGHEYTVEITEKPTGDAAGAAKADCGECGDTKDLVLPPLSEGDYTHTVVKEATETETGKETYTAVIDGVEVTVEVEIPKLSCTHKNTEIRNAKAPTCTEKGYSGDEVCTNCGTVVKKGEDVPANCPSARYTDVKTTNWFHLPVDFVTERGLMNGTEKTTFAPNVNLTRAMMVTILYRYEGEPSVSGTMPFRDVPQKEYYYDAVRWAAQEGVVKGTSADTFSPNARITREQMVAILYRYAEYKGVDVSAKANLSVFPDADRISGYAQPAFAWAVSADVIHGSDGKLLPKGQATRAEVATMLQNFILEVIEKA